MPFLIRLRLSHMNRFLLPFLFLAAGCTTSRQQTATAEAQVLHSYSTHIYKTASNYITINVTDKTSNEPIPSTLIAVTDSLLHGRIGMAADVNGKWKINAVKAAAVFEHAGGIKFSMVGYQSLLVLNPKLQTGDSIVVQLKPLVIDCCIWDVFPPPLTDPFSPQNKTIDRKEIRRMPK